MPQQQCTQPAGSTNIRFKGTITSPGTMTSADLFGNTRLIIIKHAGVEYRLSITSKDKLILTK